MVYRIIASQKLAILPQIYAQKMTSVHGKRYWYKCGHCGNVETYTLQLLNINSYDLRDISKITGSSINRKSQFNLSCNHLEALEARTLMEDFLLPQSRPTLTTMTTPNTKKGYPTHTSWHIYKHRDFYFLTEDGYLLNYLLLYHEHTCTSLLLVLLQI